MKHVTLLGAVLALSACAGMVPAVHPQRPAVATAKRRSSAAPHLYAFLSDTTATTVAGFALDANGETTPLWSLSGPKTRLQSGHGIGFGPTGILYVLAGSPGQPLKLLQFGKDKKGNALPAAEYRFPSRLLVDYTIGPCFDSSGNIWVADAAGSKVRAYAIRGKRLVQIDEFVPRQLTSQGWRKASPSAIFADGSNHLYVWSSYFYQSHSGIGLSEYNVANAVKPRLMRGFYDPQFPEVPPNATAVDAKGYIYAANVNAETGVRVYKPFWGHWLLPVSIVGAHEETKKPKNELGNVVGLAVLADGTLYVAVTANGTIPAGVAVYPPHAHDDPPPERILTNAQYLKYPAISGNDYGNLLVIK